jgi:hypothetical protein
MLMQISSGSIIVSLYQGAQRTYPRRILTHLLPLRLLQGHLPSEELLQRFPILARIFSPFISAIRKGDITAFDEAMDKWETQLIDLNLWLTLEKAREICLRGLFRKVLVSSIYCMLFCYAEVDFKVDRFRKELPSPNRDVPRSNEDVRTRHTPRRNRVFVGECDLQRVYTRIYKP